jgi:hypothetical protein
MEKSEIMFNSDDDCFTRTRNICKFAGFYVREHETPLFGLLAEAINTYMKVDKIAETKSRNGEHNDS